MHTSLAYLRNDAGAASPPPLRGKKMERQQTAKERYDARTAYKMGLKFNRGTDADIVKQLEKVENKQGYIKDLIRKDLQK